LFESQTKYYMEIRRFQIAKIKTGVRLAV